MPARINRKIYTAACESTATDSAGGAQFAGNLFDSLESDIAHRPENTLKLGHVEVHGRAGHEMAPRKGWKPLVLVALAVLLIEWYIYNRWVFL